MKPALRVLSLCSGIGGIDLAAEWAGMEIAGQVEIDAFCRAVLAKHWPHVPRREDIHDVRGDEFGPVDLVVAGFPCPPVSYAGKRRGQADDRWLWPEVCRVITASRPAWCLLENVPGLISLGLDEVLSDLERAGYATGTLVVPAAGVGAPHLRERVFIVGWLVARPGDCVGVGQADADRARRQQESSGARSDEAAHAGRGAPHDHEPAGAGQGTDDMADTDPDGQSQPRGLVREVGEWLEDRRQSDMANTESRGPRCRPASWPDGQPAQPDEDGVGQEADTARERAHGRGHTWDGWAESANGGGVEHASGAGRQEWRAPAEPGSAGYAAGRSAARGDDGGGDASQGGRPESRLGGGADELPGRLDCARFVAGPQEAQHAWEPPRVTPAKVSNRAARLKALGNAVDPRQVYPILAAIAEADRSRSTRHA